MSRTHHSSIVTAHYKVRSKKRQGCFLELRKLATAFCVVSLLETLSRTSFRPWTGAAPFRTPRLHSKIEKRFIALYSVRLQFMTKHCAAGCGKSSRMGGIRP
jgi:hypothetical protein